MPATFTIPSIFTAVDKFSGPIKVMGNSVQSFVNKSEVGLARAERGFRKLMSPITSINKMLMGLGFYVGLYSLIRLVRGAVNIMADFQQANVDLAIVMGTTSDRNKDLALDARKIGLAYGVAATDVVKMQHALATLGFEKPDILKMGGPLITGASALEGANPQRLAETVGALINSFDALKTTDTQHILDVMALSANRTALNFEKLATTLPIVSAPANAVNISFERTVALLGVLQNAGVHVATSATSLKNIFIDSAKKGHTYEQVLANIAKHSDKLTYANKKFGKRSVVSALILSQKMHEARNGVQALTTEFEHAQVGLTTSLALQRLDTFSGSVLLAKAAYQEFVLSIEDGTGKYAKNLQKIMQVVAAMFLLASDTEASRETLRKMNAEVVTAAAKYLKWVKIIGYLIAAFIALRIAMMAWAVITAIAKGVMIGYNVVMGASIALGWGNIFMLRSSAIAMGAFKVVTWIVTAAQWAWNAAMLANPIGLIILGIAALIGYVVLVTKKWNEWGAAVAFVAGPFGFFLSLIQSFRRNWDAIIKSFTGEGIIAGLKKIGATILDAILMPLQQIFKLMSSLPGKIGTSAAKMVELIDVARHRLDVNTDTDESGNPLPKVQKINPKTSQNDALIRSIETTRNASVDINVNDPQKRLDVRPSFSDLLKIQTSSTMGY